VLATQISTSEWIAIAAGGGALLSLLATLILAVRLRRLRRAQRQVLGDHGERDLVVLSTAGVEVASERRQERLSPFWTPAYLGEVSY